MPSSGRNIKKSEWRYDDSLWLDVLRHHQSLIENAQCPLQTANERGAHTSIQGGAQMGHPMILVAALPLINSDWR